MKRMTEKEKIIVNEFYQNHTLVETSEKFGVGKSTIKKYCSKRVYLTDEERKKNSVKAVTKRRRKIKRMSVEYKGGKCEKCGYNKSLSALEFHHLDPSEKDFSIGNGGNSKSWEKIKVELDKCILVCANCHREIHDEIDC